MRTIEMLGAKRKLITTNKNIKDYDFYNSSNILIIDRDEVIINKDFFDVDFQNLNSEVAQKHSLNQWIKKIFKA